MHTLCLDISCCNVNAAVYCSATSLEATKSPSQLGNYTGQYFTKYLLLLGFRTAPLSGPSIAPAGKGPYLDDDNE